MILFLILLLAIIALIVLFIMFYKHVGIYNPKNNNPPGGSAYPPKGPNLPPAPPPESPPDSPHDPKPIVPKHQDKGTHNQIGVNLGSWLTMETWMFDFPPFKPQANSNGLSDFGGKVPNNTNYQRGELGTIREVNGDLGVFNGNC